VVSARDPDPVGSDSGPDPTLLTFLKIVSFFNSCSKKNIHLNQIIHYVQAICSFEVKNVVTDDEQTGCFILLSRIRIRSILNGHTGSGQTCIASTNNHHSWALTD
jgi:hypothetical protein